jgi:hypothetical protein
VTNPKDDLREELIEEMQLMMGGGLVDIELDPGHYDLAIKKAVRRYRQRSSNSLQEAFVFVNVQHEVSEYTLPAEIQEVRSVMRRSMTGTTGGPMFDPFSAAFANNIYMISNPGGLNSGGTGTLALYDFAHQFQKTAGLLFGRDVQFTWNPSTKKIIFHRKFSGEEEVGLHVYLAQPEEVLLADPYARPWIQDYALAQAKFMLGEAYSKYASLAGPQGGINLKGDAMKSEATEEMRRLDDEVKAGVDSNQGYGFIIG